MDVGWKRVWHRNGTALFVVKLRDVIFGLPLFQHMLHTVSGNTGTQLKTTQTPTEVCVRISDPIEERFSTVRGSSCTISLSARLQTEWNSEVLALELCPC